MLTDPEELLSAARNAGAQQAEIFQVENEEIPVRFEANRLKELNTRRTAGSALRVIAGGRVGFASSTLPGASKDLVEAAIETAPFGPEAQFDFPASSRAPAVNAFDADTQALAVDALIELGQRLVDAIVRVQPDILCDAQVRRTTGTVKLVNSNGGYCEYRRSTLSVWVYGTLIRGTDMLFVGDGDASCSPILDTGRIEGTVARQLEYSRRTATARTAEMPVLFTPNGVAEALLPPLLMAFNGRLVLQRQSPLAERLGEEIYDPRVCISDDATLPMRPASRPLDDEGTPSRPISLIDQGRVGSFMYDLQSAGQAGTMSTGSAERSLSTQPAISTTSILVSAGDATFDDMVRDIKEGIVVEELMGAGQGNVMGGDFSGNVLLGYKIENGEIIGRVKDTIVAGNVHDALRTIRAIGSERRWVGGAIHTPPILFQRLAVSAKG